MHRARRPTRSESLRRVTVLLAVSGRAFCAVTTLPPPEQAAVESREQLAGHQATASLSLSLFVRKKIKIKSGANGRRTAPLVPPLTPATQR